MKKWFTYASAILISLFLFSCGGGGGGSSSSGGGGGSSTQTFTIGGSISGLTGSITLLNNSGNPLTLTSSGSFTFSTPVNQGSSYAVTIGAQPSGQSCSISQATGANVQANITSVLVSCLNTGKFAYVPNFAGNNISGFSINQSTGALSAIAGSPYTAGSLPRDIAVTPSGKFAYAINNGSNTISQYSINATTGALTAIVGFISTGSGPVKIIAEPSGKFVYVANQSSNSISSYSVNQITGELTDLATTPTGSQPISMAINGAGTYLYTANYTDSTVSVFAINASTGSLTPISGSPFATGQAPIYIIASPSGGFVYVACQGDLINPATTGISISPINLSTGALLASTSFVSGFSVSMAIDPTGQYLYSVGVGIDGYSINSSTGLLSSLTNSPFTTGPNPISVSIDPSGQFAYVPQMFTDAILAFTLNASTGQLTASGSYNAGPGVNVITITPGSR
jgi:6-phosphogluconolactonase